MADDNNNIDSTNVDANTTQQSVVNQDEMFKNLKSEFSRKQENVQAQLEELKNIMLSQSQQKNVKKEETIAKPDPIVDPDAYEAYILKKAEDKISASMNQNNQRQAQLSALVQQYPELQDGNSDLTKKAVDIYNRLSQEEKMSPNAYKFAVQDAALDLGVVPMSKRQQYNPNDDYVGSSSNTTSSKQRTKKNEPELDPMTIEFAKALGRPVNDAEYIKRLKEANKRKSWNKGQ